MANLVEWYHNGVHDTEKPIADYPWRAVGITLEERHRAFHDDLRGPQKIIETVEPERVNLGEIIRSLARDPFEPEAPEPRGPTSYMYPGD